MSSTSDVITSYYKLRRGYGTEYTLEVTPWLLVDMAYDGRPVGYEIIGDHNHAEVVQALTESSHVAWARPA